MRENFALLYTKIFLNVEIYSDKRRAAKLKTKVSRMGEVTHSFLLSGAHGLELVVPKTTVKSSVKKSRHFALLECTG